MTRETKTTSPVPKSEKEERYRVAILVSVGFTRKHLELAEVFAMARDAQDVMPWSRSVGCRGRIFELGPLFTAATANAV